MTQRSSSLPRRGEAAHDRRTRGARRRQAAGRAHVRRAGHAGRGARGSDRVRRSRRRAGALRRRGARRWLPLLAALATITGSLLALDALASVAAISEFAVNVVTLLGLGLAVDYSLLVIARFREERTATPQAPVPEVLARTMAGAGRAVLVSGLAVAIALAGLHV